jgi:hypothetical protein
MARERIASASRNVVAGYDGSWADVEAVGEGGGHRDLSHPIRYACQRRGDPHDRATSQS